LIKIALLIVNNANLFILLAKINGRILKANSRWSPTLAKICQLIASLSVVLLQQLKLTKLNLEYLKYSAKKVQKTQKRKI